MAPIRSGVDHEPLEVTAMTWEAPDFVEVKMDAEINSYQDDFGGEQDDRF
jgi:coenzyme PQQ precursor peptide PqqA